MGTMPRLGLNFPHFAPSARSSIWQEDRVGTREKEDTTLSISSVDGWLKIGDVTIRIVTLSLTGVEGSSSRRIFLEGGTSSGHIFFLVVFVFI